MDTKMEILIHVPKTCMFCGSNLILDDAMEHLSCSNSECPSKLGRRLEVMAKAFKIDNIGEITAHSMVESCSISRLGDLFRLTVEDLKKVPAFQEGMATKVYTGIHAQPKVSWENFILGIQLPRVGKGGSTLLAKRVQSLENLLILKEDAIKDLFKNSSKAIIDNIQERKEEIEDIAESVIIVYGRNSSRQGKNVANVQKFENSPFTPDAALMDMFSTGTVEDSDDIEFSKDLSDIGTVVITGDLETDGRHEFQRKMGIKYNITFGSSVSSKTAILIANNPSSSSKFTKARSFGTKIMSEKEFLDLIDSRL